jgi:DNA polymerase III sliding clamp (beta) subunit (PCNA family)
MSTATATPARPDAKPAVPFNPVLGASAEVSPTPTSTPMAEEVRVTVPTAGLRAAVSTLRSVAARQSEGGPPLSGVRLDIEEASITVGATNLRTTHTIPLGATATGPGMLLVPAGLLADVLHNLRVETVTLTGTAEGVVIEAGRATFTLCELAKGQYPTLPIPQPGAALTLPGEVFEQIADAVLPSASRDETRPTLTHVRITAEGHVVQALATDSYRVAVAAFTLEEPIAAPAELLVPVSAIERAAAAARRGDGLVRIADDERQVAISLDAEHIVAQRSAGEYPDIAQIIAIRERSEDVVTVSVPVADLHAIVRRAATIISKRTALPLRLRFASGELTISSYDTAGSFIERMPIEHDGDTVEIGLAPAYLEEALRFASLSDGETTIRVAQPNDAVLFDSPEARYLLMPIRLDGPPGEDEPPAATDVADGDGAPVEDVEIAAADEPDTPAAPPSASEPADTSDGPTGARPGGGGKVYVVSVGAAAAPETEMEAAADEPAGASAASAITLATPTIERRARAIRADYLVSTLPDGIRRVVELSVHHLGAPHKCFAATLARAEVNNDTLGVARTQTLITGTIDLCHKPVSRFSEKGLDAFFEEAKAELERRRTDAEVAALFVAVADDQQWLP